MCTFIGGIFGSCGGGSAGTYAVLAALVILLIGQAIKP